MNGCVGALVVHTDATSAACTEELEGRRCAGLHIEHAGGRVSCQELLGAGACETCALDAWGVREWRHAVHVGRAARRAGDCAAHRRLRRPVSARHDLDARPRILQGR